MKYRSFLLHSLAAALIVASYGARAQQADEVSEAPAFEHYTVIQRLDPATGVVFADGRNYYLQPYTRIWINNRVAKQAELSPDMIGLRIGLDAYEDESRYLITMIQILTNGEKSVPDSGDTR